MKYVMILFFIFFFFSCASVPKEENVPHDMEVIDLVQKAQEAFEINNYRGAKKWYEIVVKRFGDDLPTRIEAEYEIAHILVKQKKWKDAYKMLISLINIYESENGMKMPPEFYKLAKMDYEKVVAKLPSSYIQNKNSVKDEGSQNIKDDKMEEEIMGEEEDSSIELVEEVEEEEGDVDKEDDAKSEEELS